MVQRRFNSLIFRYQHDKQIHQRPVAININHNSNSNNNDDDKNDDTTIHHQSDYYKRATTPNSQFFRDQNRSFVLLSSSHINRHPHYSSFFQQRKKTQLNESMNIPVSLLMAVEQNWIVNNRKHLFWVREDLVEVMQLKRQNAIRLVITLAKRY